MLLLLGLPLSNHHKHRDAPVKVRQAPKKERTTIHLIWKGEEAGDHDSGPILNQIPFSPIRFLPQSMNLLPMMHIMEHNFTVIDILL